MRLSLLYILVVFVTTEHVSSGPVPFRDKTEWNPLIGNNLPVEVTKVSKSREGWMSSPSATSEPIAIPILSKTEELSSPAGGEDDSDSIQSSESRTNSIADVLKALNLPSDFMQPKTSTPAPIESTIDAANLRRADEETTTAEPITTTTIAISTTTTAIVAAAATTDDSQPPSATPPVRMFMTGNSMLDKIMNCPCAKEQLSAVGVKGVAYSSQPDPAIYREPPYGPDAPGPGDYIATSLKSAGGKTGNVFGQIIRLVLGIPTWALSVLKPLIGGIVDTLAQTTEAAAEVTGQAAKQIPQVLRSTAVVAKKLLEAVGDVAGSLLQVIANLVAALAAAKTSLAGTLPFGFDIIGDLSGMFGGMVGTIVDFLSGTLEPLSNGVVNAAKTGGNIFSGLVEGSKGFKNGLLEGIKYGVNDEEPPQDPNAPAGWR